MQISATEQDIRKYRALGTKVSFVFVCEEGIEIVVGLDSERTHLQAEEDLALLQEQTPELEEEHSVKRRVHDLLEDFEGNSTRYVL